ncbi:hypothetical protein Nepgr_001747 [Nepenthes gracilis]|uniref:Uncharacterized protein n=1 Tax=Nepenthes gracilis TaxID=150966 RepID=A0AAD3P5M6_NEPGR|nr:hypothetical protein Nepgr_001747 [Nepenthes gracilis]
MNNYSTSASRSSSAGHSVARKGARKLPVLFFDVMDTVVRDPFFEDIPALFGYHSTLPFGIRNFELLYLFDQRRKPAKNLGRGSRNLVALFYVFASNVIEFGVTVLEFSEVWFGCRMSREFDGIIQT